MRKQLSQALANPDTTFIIWDEPCYGLTKDGQDYTGNTRHRMSVTDAIAHRRLLQRDRVALGRPPEISEQQLLEDFMTVHWASFEGDER